MAEDTHRLRLYFNKMFDEMFAIKKREMDVIRESIDRVIFIKNELRTLFNEIIQEECTYPIWNSREMPMSHITIKDEELTAKDYISQSRQELLDKQVKHLEFNSYGIIVEDVFISIYQLFILSGCRRGTNTTGNVGR